MIHLIFRLPLQTNFNRSINFGFSEIGENIDAPKNTTTIKTTNAQVSIHWFHEKCKNRSNQGFSVIWKESKN